MKTEKQRDHSCMYCMQYNSTLGSLGMTLKPRWVHLLNFREEDKAMLDAAIVLARRDGSDLTHVIRDALKEYTAAKLRGEAGQKLDSFIDGVGSSSSSFKKLLSPKELKGWSDVEII